MNKLSMRAQIKKSAKAIGSMASAMQHLIIQTKDTTVAVATLYKLLQAKGIITDEDIKSVTEEDEAGQTNSDTDTPRDQGVDLQTH